MAICTLLSLWLTLAVNVAAAGAPGPEPATPAATATPAAAEEQSTPAAEPFPTELTGFYAEYEAQYLGFSAEVKLHLRALNTAGMYQYDVVTKARGLAKLVRSGTGTETAQFLLDANGFQPQNYHLDDGTKELENDTDIEFDWDANIAYSVYKGEPKQIELQPGMLDRLTTDVVVIHALRNGIKTGSYEITDRNSIRVYEYTPQGSETISVPAGEFETVKYLRQRPGSSRAVMIWFAPAAAYLPVRIEQMKRGKTNVVTVATQLQPNAAR